MSKYIVCPNCGKLVIKDDCITTYKLFYAYKTCCNCGRKFTKLNKGIKIFIYLYLFVLLAIMITCLCIITVYKYDELTQNETPVNIFMYLNFIFCMIGIINYSFSHVLSKKNIEHSDNGFLPIIEDKNQTKLISFVNEKTYTRNEIEKVGYLSIVKENAIVLLPCHNIIMKVSLNEEVLIDKLQLYFAYKIAINGFDKFIILTDYKVDNNNVILYFKKFDEYEVTNEIYDLFTINNELVCKIRLLS